MTCTALRTRTLKPRATACSLASAVLILVGLVTLVTTSRADGAVSKESYVPSVETKRSEVPAKYKWDTSVWFKDTAAWEASLAELEARLGKLADFKGRLADGAAVVTDALDTYYGMAKDLEWLHNHAFTAYSVDRTIDAEKARYDRAQAIGSKLNQAGAFIEPELLALDAAVLKGYVKADGALANYSHFFDDLLRRKAHVLSPELEGQLALSGDLRAGPYSMVNALHQDIVFPKIKDEDGAEVQLAMSNFGRYRASKDRRVRKEAVTAFFDTLQGFGRSLAASLDMAVKTDIFVARARGYESAIEASLDGNAVPVAVYDRLLETTAEFLPRTLHRYVALRKRVLGLDDIHYYDLYTSLVPSVERSLDYDKAVAEVIASVKPLGEAYVSVLAAGLDTDSGWTDVYPNAGKRSGAYCTAAYGVHPFVFMNYMNELDDAFTLAHEYGHAMHFHLANSAQTYINAETSIFLAEIASTFNEEMLLSHLLAKARGKDEKLALLNKRLENIRTTIFRQIMFADFERAIHGEVEKGGALTSDRINDIYGGLIRKYYGPDFVIDADDAAEWSYVPHFYYNFYVYQYATGLMSAIALSQTVQSGAEGSQERYLDFLKAGGSDYPLEILRRAGVDYDTAAPMTATFELFERTLAEFEALLDD